MMKITSEERLARRHNKRRCLAVQSAMTVLAGLVLSLSASAAASWPRFRGPNGSGVSEDATPPVHFGPETNVLWKVLVPPGRSSPVVWGNHLFLTVIPALVMSSR
jgi:hypothetical protein